TMAPFGRLMRYRKGNPPLREFLTAREPVKFVLGMTGVETLTHKTVTRVRQNWERNTALYERTCNESDEITLQGTKALQQGNLEEIADIMNVCQGLLNALQVSSWELEELLQIARDNGALGAKRTGGGGGGSMIALCPDNAERVMKAMRDKGYQAMEVTVGG